jgi:hypothetical protein
MSVKKSVMPRKFWRRDGVCARYPKYCGPWWWLTYETCEATPFVSVDSRSKPSWYHRQPTGAMLRLWRYGMSCWMSGVSKPGLRFCLMMLVTLLPRHRSGTVAKVMFEAMFVFA